jgi:hypothetical protein
MSKYLGECNLASERKIDLRDAVVDLARAAIVGPSSVLKVYVAS